MASKPDGSIFKHAESLRSSLTKEQQKRIKKLYEDWAKDIEERAAKLAKKTNPSATLSNAQANILKKQIEATGKQVANGVYTEVKNGMLEVSEAVLGDAGKFMKGLGFPEDGISAAFSNVSASVVNSLVTGSVYGKPGSWSLSKSIWSDNEGTMQKAYEIVAKGIAENLPVQDIAELLHDFVSPDRRVPWVGPKGSRIYTKKIDYNAQRLARTLSQHTYQQSMVAAVEDNPFIDSCRWVSNGSRACDLCKQRDGKIFKKDEVPLDHPNGMCVMEPVADVDEMTTRLADWVKGKDDPDVDKFAKHFGYEKPKSMSLDDIKKKYTQGIDSKIPSKWYKGLPKDVQEEVTRIHQASGMKWKDWYQKHIMKGGAGSIDDVAKSTAQKATSAAKKQTYASKKETTGQKVRSNVRVNYFEGSDDIDALRDLAINSGKYSFMDILKLGDDIDALRKAADSIYADAWDAADAFRAKHAISGNADDITKALRSISEEDVPATLNKASVFQRYSLLKNSGDMPDVVDELPNDGVAVYRAVKGIHGLPAQAIQDMTKYDRDAFVGYGIFGDGIYFSSSKVGAAKYGSSEAGSIMYAEINKSAKMIDYDDLVRMKSESGETSADDSIWAIEHGYEVIAKRVDRDEEGEVYYCVLKRSALTIKK